MKDTLIVAVVKASQFLLVLLFERISEIRDLLIVCVCIACVCITIVMDSAANLWNAEVALVVSYLHW